ncbi:MAG: septation protein SpoVG family protein [Candidatus Omnitrophica bacterium]|nr:septation protein SpoVG family protein [Candidatus Omnitrophota bacterium]
MTTVDMEVVDVRKMTMDGNLKGRADVKIGGSFIVKGVSVVQGKNGLFVSMPRRANKDGNWFDIVEPVNDRIKRELQDRVLEAYDREVDGVE